jgi:hypothetical protein
MNKRTSILCALVGLAAWLTADAASASQTPVTYRGFAVTDVMLGNKFYHNASLYLTFTGFVENVQSFGPVYAGPYSDEAMGAWNLTGHATVKIQSGVEEIEAAFLPGQIVVTYDSYNGGIGFGAYVGTGAGLHLEPAYPLAFDFCCGSNTTDPKLTSSGTWSGNAWSCISFPIQAGTGDGYCSDPYPLGTTRGDLIVYQPYTQLNPDGTIYDDYSGSLNAGIFSTDVGP